MNEIEKVRAQLPELQGLDDQQVVDVLHQTYYPKLGRDAVAKRLGIGAPEAPKEGSGIVRRVVGDSAVSLLKGAISVPEAAVGLANLATGGHAGRLAEQAGFKPREAKQALDELYSPEQQAANAKVQQADGFGDTLMAAVENPSTIAHAVLESAPSLLPAGAVARGAIAVAPRFGGAVAAGLGEGAVAAGQAAEQIRQQTSDGLLSGEQSGLAAGSGALTGLLGAVAGKVANRLGIGDINQLVAGVRSAAPEVQKGIARKMVEGFAAEGLLQELPQSAQEQVAQNLALGRPWDEGVANAAAMGALAGGVMGAGAAPIHAQPSPAAAAAEQVRAGKLPETGTLTKATNAGIEAQAQAIEATPAPMPSFGFKTEEGAREFAARYHPEWKTAQKDDGLWSFVEPAPIPTEEGSATEVPSNFDTRLKAAREDVGAPETLQALRDEFGKQGASDVLQALSVIEQGTLPVRTRERMLMGVEQRLAELRMSVIEQPVAPSGPAALAAPPVLEQIAMEPAPLVIENSPTASGVLIADEAGQVRHQSKSEAFRDAQEAERKADIGLTPDVERASMRAAMGNVTQPGDLLAAGEVPFRNRRAATASVARVGDGYEVVEIAPDAFVGRRPAVEAMAIDPGEHSQEAEVASPTADVQQSRAEELAGDDGQPYRSRQVAARKANLNPGFVPVEVEGGWVLRKPAADLAGEPINKEWQAFADDSGTLKVPRAEMPQVKAEHRGAMVNFLNARGISHEQVEVAATDLKPTQAEFSPSKVEAAKTFQGGDRSILVSSDGHVLDGHHQWLAKRDAGEPIKAIRLNAPIEQLISEVKAFPSAEAAAGATSVDGDKPVLRRGSPAGEVGVTADQIKASLAKVIDGWTNGPKGGVQIVQSVSDLPENIRAGLKVLDAEGIVRALFMPNDQSVYVVADNLNSVEEAQFALAHEVLGHFGLRSIMSKPALESMLVRMQKANPGLRREADAWFAAHGQEELAARLGRNMKRDAALREVALLAVEEALADRAGRNVPVSSLRFMAAQVQKALRVVGLDKVADWLESRTGAEVLDLLRQAREYVHAMPRPWVGERSAAPAMSKKSDDPVLSRSTAQAVADLAPQLVKDMLKGQRSFKRLNWWHKTVGTQYDLAAKNAEFKRVFDAAQAYLRDTSFFANDAADQAPGVLPQLNELRDIGKALSLSEADRKAVAAPVFEGTLNWTRDESGRLVESDDVATAGVVFTDQELRDRFKLDDRQVGLYREFRAAVDRSLDSTGAGDVLRYLGKDASDGMKDLAREGQFQALRDVVTQHVEQMPAGKLREEMLVEVAEKYDRLEQLKARGYAPLMRFGRYAVHVQDKLNNTLFFSLYESATDAARAARQLQAEFPDAAVQRSTMSQEEFKQLKGISPETAQLFARISGMDQNEAMQRWLKEATSSRSALKRMIKRKGIEGYSEDVSRVLSSFITSNARAASQAIHIGEMKDQVESIAAGDVKDAAIRLADYVQNPTEEAAGLRGFLFVHFIGGSLASAAVNLTQPFMMTMPYLSQFVGLTDAGRIMAKLAPQAATGRISDEDLRTAVGIAEKEGIVAPQELHQLQAMAMGRGSVFGNAARFLGANDKIASAADTAGKRAMFLWGAPFALAEQFNRRLTFMAAYRLAVDKGLDDPFKFAAQAVTETQGLYNKANRPEWARGAIGATLFTFKQYSISYLEFMKRMWTAGEPGTPERLAGQKAALFGIALLVLAAGAQGLPGADDVDDIVDTIGQKMGHDTNSKRWKQENLPAWLNYGFSALPGIPLDVAGRLSVGNLLPGTGLLRMDKSDKSGDVLEVAGPAGAVAKGITEAADAGSLVPLLPVAIKNFYKGVQTARHDAYLDTRGRRVIEADRVDAAVKAIGFQPATVAAASRADGLVMSRQALARNVEARIASDWAAARFEGDQAGEQAARQALADWNEKNPDTPIGITMGQIQKRVRQMRMTRQQRMDKSSTKELRAAEAGRINA